MFENMKLGTKLTFSFVVVAIIGLIMGLLGIYNMSRVDSYVDKLYSKDLLGLSYVKEAEIVRLRVARDWRNALLAETPEEKRKFIDVTEKNIALFEENTRKAAELFYTEQGKKIISEIFDNATEWEKLTRQMTLMIMQQNLMQATPEFNEIRKLQTPIGRGIDDKLSELAKLKQEFAQKTVAESNGLYEHNLIMMSVLVGLSFVVSIAIGFVYARYLTKQLGGELKDAIEQVKKVSQGDFSGELNVSTHDDSLLYALKIMQDTLMNFVAAQETLAEKHKAGWIYDKMDASRFQGIYRQIVEEINTLTQMHVSAKMEVVDVVSHYARGDFSHDVTRYPNDRAKVTKGVDAIKSSLLEINSEIEMIAEAGAKGDFSKRSRAENFEFMFKDMLTHLNELMKNCQVAFDDIELVASALAKGDLTHTVDANYPGTFGKVVNSVNGTVENLRALVGEIYDSTDSISDAAKEIATGNNDLSQRTEEQAASLEETAASMQEFTSMVQNNRQNAQYANELALASSQIAKTGVVVVNQVVSTMEAINDSSRKIVDIISVIDGIAFQTNILALNAAVEAARAGDQGRGFAVVATEVRSLAQRAAAAAGEIKGLIGNSVEKVEDGTKLVAKAGKTMEEIVSSIENVSTTVTSITSASHEQSAGIEQVNHAIGQMDDATQQNAALVEEAAAAAESLEEQTRHLSTIMSNFKMTHQKQRAVVSAPIARPKPTVVALKPKIVETPPVPVDENLEPIDIDLDGAMQKHADWKMKLRNAISNKEHLDEETISKDNCCDFGKWLHHEDTHPHISHLASYHDCVKFHAEFHKEAGRIAGIINQGRYHEAEEMLSGTSEFAKRSTAVGSAIIRLKKDTKPKPKKVEPKKAEISPQTDLNDDWEEF